MSIKSTYGTYEIANNDVNTSSFDMSLDKSDVLNNWEQCSHAANRLSCKFSHIFEGNKKSKNLVSYIFNELIENAVKYSSSSTEPIRLTCSISPYKVALESYNITNLTFAKKFDNYLQETHSDTLEKIFYDYLLNAAEGNSQHSGIGLLIIRKDFNAHVGFKITPRKESAEEFDIHVKIELGHEEINKYDNIN